MIPSRLAPRKVDDVFRPRAVIIRGSREREWGRYATRDDAEIAARQLRRHGFDARVTDRDAP